MKLGNVLITGGTGSFGETFIRYLLNSSAKINKITVFSRDEYKQYKLLHKFQHNPKLRMILGDVKDFDRVNFTIKGSDTIIHAAALKQIDTAEYNPFEFIKTNINGAENIVKSCLESPNTKSVIALSTDKSCKPTSLYGTTKLASDKIFLSANHLKGKRNINFNVVRYGNVFGSRGSVVPHFLSLKKQKKIFEITDPNMTRFSLTLDEACESVYWCLKNNIPGALIIPRPKVYKLMDLMHAISTNAKYKIIGKRVNEKLHEQLLSEEENEYLFEYNNYLLSVSTLNISNFKKKAKFKMKKKKPIDLTSNKGSFLKINDLRKLINNFESKPK